MGRLAVERANGGGDRAGGMSPHKTFIKITLIWIATINRDPNIFHFTPN
jgi:hypothetical protein